jgi:hypothetical protein
VGPIGEIANAMATGATIAVAITATTIRDDRGSGVGRRLFDRLHSLMAGRLHRPPPPLLQAPACDPALVHVEKGRYCRAR